MIYRVQVDDMMALVGYIQHPVMIQRALGERVTYPRRVGRIVASMATLRDLRGTPGKYGQYGMAVQDSAVANGWTVLGVPIAFDETLNRGIVEFCCSDIGLDD
jgi:hypothetical protein